MVDTLSWELFFHLFFPSWRTLSVFDYIEYICARPIHCRKCCSICKNCFCSCNGQSPFDFLNSTKGTKRKLLNTSLRNSNRDTKKISLSKKINTTIRNNDAKASSDHNLKNNSVNDCEKTKLRKDVPIRNNDYTDKCNKKATDNKGATDDKCATDNTVKFGIL